MFARFCPLEVSETEVATRAHGGVPSVRRAHIKAVTFSDLKIVRIGGQLEATIVFDV